MEEKCYEEVENWSESDSDDKRTTFDENRVIISFKRKVNMDHWKDHLEENWESKMTYMSNS